MMAVQRKIAHQMAAIAGPIFGHGPLFTQGLPGVAQTEGQRLMQAMFRLIGVIRRYVGVVRLKAPLWATQINSNIRPATMAVQRKIARPMAAIAGTIFGHGLRPAPTGRLLNWSR
jgi:hypothetical protein